MVITKMKDIHCHILNGIDDGSKTIEESIKILREACNNGITDIVLTPHYIKNSSYSCNNKEKNKLLNILKEEASNNNIDINLYLGNEIMIDKDIIELIKKGEASTINDTKYVLIEFPMHSLNNNIEDILFLMIRNGYVPIIAHPERYSYVQKNIELVDNYIELGAVLQGNYQSLFGMYGKDAKKTLIKLLKDNKISLLASDIHHDSMDYRIEKTKKKLKRVIKSEEIINDLLINNFDKIINNKSL